MGANMPPLVRDALNRARKEQQKFILLAYAGAQHPNVSSESNSIVENSNREFMSRCYAVGLAALNADLDFALTFAYLAVSSWNNTEKRCRNRGNARKALDSVARIGKRLALTDEDARQLKDKLTCLGSVLEHLGGSL